MTYNLFLLSAAQLIMALVVFVSPWWLLAAVPLAVAVMRRAIDYSMGHVGEGASRARWDREARL